MRLVPRFREGADRLGLVTVRQMIAALVNAVEHAPPPGDVRIVGAPEIRGSLKSNE
jgi:hypothetical protein